MLTLLAIFALVASVSGTTQLPTVSQCSQFSVPSLASQDDVDAAVQKCNGYAVQVPGLGNEGLQDPCVACSAYVGWNADPSAQVLKFTLSCMPFSQVGQPNVVIAGLCTSLSGSTLSCQGSCSQPIGTEVNNVAICHNTCADPYTSATWNSACGASGAPVWQSLNVTLPGTYFASTCPILLTRNGQIPANPNAQQYPQYVGSGALFRDYWGNCTSTYTPQSC